MPITSDSERDFTRKRTLGCDRCPLFPLTFHRAVPGWVGPPCQRERLADWDRRPGGLPTSSHSLIVNKISPPPRPHPPPSTR